MTAAYMARAIRLLILQDPSPSAQYPMQYARKAKMHDTPMPSSSILLRASSSHRPSGEKEAVVGGF